MIALLRYLPYAAAALAGALLVSGPVFIAGKRAERATQAAEAAQKAWERIEGLEKSNESFKRGTDRQRCLIFMRDSGLPDSECD